MATNLGTNTTDARSTFNEYLEKPLILEGSTDSGEGVKISVPFSNAMLGDLNDVVRAKSGDLITVPPDWLSLEPSSFRRVGTNTFVINNPGAFKFFSVGDKLKITFAGTGLLYYYIVGKRVGTNTIKVVRSKPSVSDIDIPNETINAVSYTNILSPVDFPGLMDHVPTVTSTGAGITVNGLTPADYYNKFYIVGKICSMFIWTNVNLTVNTGTGVPIKMTLPCETDITGQHFSYITVIPTNYYHGWVDIGGFGNAVSMFSWDGLITGNTLFSGHISFPIKTDQ